jgi:hypothetical protein
MLSLPLRRLLRRWARWAPSSQAGRAARAHPPRVEWLEARTLPATVFWTNPAGGDWDTAGNWSTGQTPGAQDDAVITAPAGVTVTHSRAVADTVHSLASQAALAVSGGSLTVTGDAEVDRSLALSGGGLASGGTWAVNGLLTWTAGTVSGAGRLRAAGGLAVGGPVSKVLDGGTIDNTGAAAWTAGTIFAANGGALNNLAGATFDVQGDVSLTDMMIGDAPSFNNAGTFRKSGGTGTAAFNGVPFNNSGSVTAQSGTLSLAGGGGGGQWSVTFGNVLDFAGGAFYFDAASSITSGITSSGGLVRFGGGTSTVAGDFRVVPLALTGGTLNFLSAPTLYDVAVSGVLSPAQPT